MNNKCRYFQVACVASISILLGACSNSSDVKVKSAPIVVSQPNPVLAQASNNQGSNTQIKTPPVVVKKTVVAIPKKASIVSKPYVAPQKKYVAPKPVVAQSKPVIQKKPVVIKPKVAVQQQYVKPRNVYVPPKPIVVAINKAPVVRAPVSRPKVITPTVKPVVVSQPRVVKAPVKQVNYRPQAVAKRPVITSKRYSQARLTGDFAGNRQAEAFISMMATRHGFDRAYVTGVLSRAKATAWLKRQAYSDANPAPRKKNSRPANWTNYQKRFLTSRHINAGTAFYNKYRRSLQRAAAQYGVPEEYILGIMGVETIYGGNVGADKAIDALATMSFMNSRRGSYFASELEAYLLMTRRTGLDPLSPKASWAGALGLPQFMPSNIQLYGVDYDGDGAVNLWTPHDAIGSIANYLSKFGWRRGEIAAIPASKTGGKGYSSLDNGFKYKYSLATLANKGLKPSYPGVSGQVHLVKLRANTGTEYWIGGNNFYTITRYNHSSFYAMAVHQLAQAIKKRVKPSSRYSTPRVIKANTSKDQNLLRQAANALL